MKGNTMKSVSAWLSLALLALLVLFLYQKTLGK